jgi:transposase-like protein
LVENHEPFFKTIGQTEKGPRREYVSGIPPIAADEVYLKIDGRLVYLWRAVDSEGELLDVLVLTKRNKLRH